MRFTIYQESRQGKRRSNEDRIAYCYSRDALLMVVADGMGGHLHGEVAAQICVQLLSDSFQREATPRLRDPFLFLSRGLTSAHCAIVDYGEEHELTDAPRTTCVACVVQDNIAYWAHAGDSRLYVLRDGRIQVQTRDHSRVQRMIDRGEIDEDDAAVHPARNRIFSCLGGPITPHIDYSRKTPLKHGDVLCLCTDGMWGPLGNELILKGLVHGNVLETVRPLMDQAERLGGSGCDNLSTIAVTWLDSYESEPPAPQSISTATLPLDRTETVMEDFGSKRNNRRGEEFSEDEIERTINEINNAIQKFTR
ncbi:MAG: serine/threonine-protein phosphatase [Rhodocyclaceae bacterium]|nr:serine/threonine-protein phosphatase [Rhodocyclaceae bacterium]MBX3668494.1 serine/threonine-protein phosphatase [Rhodocyclaceae bacterium]